MEGLTGIAARMHAIQQQIHSLTPAATSSPLTSTTTSTQSAQSASGSSFASALQQATAAPVRTSGKLNSQGIPVDLAAYGNGKIPASALQSIGVGNHKLWAPAGQNFNAMRVAAARDGVTIGVTDSYRSYESQVDLAKRKGLYSQGGLAAKPGTSEHGWGLSLDLDLNAKAQSWMRTNGATYGFTENVPREPWHWTYKPTSG